MGVCFKKILKDYGGLVMAVMMVYHGGYMPVAAANSVVSRQQSEYLLD